MSNILKDLKIELMRADDTREPSPDLYHCYLCEANFDISDCDEHEEGDFENGYYIVHSCPSCKDDGGEYMFSEQRAREWVIWNDKRLISQRRQR